MTSSNLSHGVRMEAAIEQAIATITLEASTLTKMARQLRDHQPLLAQVIAHLVHVVTIGGHIVCTGMGKSGHIARKVAATFASTGSPAFFLHPAEATHGDLGMIGPKDTILVLSYSGESAEVLALLPPIKRMGTSIIAISGKSQSTLAQAADFALTIVIEKEACPHNLAPTCSTTMQLALGDALALGVLVAQGFTAEDFVRFHPAGALGKKLISVADIMRLDQLIPSVHSQTSLHDTLTEITRGKLGMAVIVDKHDDLETILGVFTDGDLRRLLQKGPVDLSTPIHQVMHKNPCSIHLNRLAAEAVTLMEQRRINQLLVLDDAGRLVGAINMHDLLKHQLV